MCTAAESFEKAAADDKESGKCVSVKEEEKRVCHFIGISDISAAAGKCSPEAGECINTFIIYDL